MGHHSHLWIICVLHNDLNQVTWEQRVMSGDPKLEASQVLPDFPYAGYAELLGLKGVRIDDPSQVGAGWDQALAAGRPALVEVITDPEVPPLPPHIEFDQAKGISKAMLKGDPATREIITASIKGKFAEFTNR